MFTKRFLVLAIFFITLVAVSTVSAAEDTGDIAVIESDTQINEIRDIATDEIQDDALKASLNDENEDELLVSEDMEILTEGPNVYVNSSYMGESIGTADQPFSNLDEALNNREDGDIIYIASGVYTGNANIGLSIENRLTLTNWGLGEVIFDAQHEGNILNIFVDGINITGITFKNGMNEEIHGGALYFENGLKDSIIDCAFINNAAMLNGGAIFVNGLIDNSVISAYFANNSALMGGAIYAYGIFNTLIDGDFFNNTAGIGFEGIESSEELLGCGGAIFVEGFLQDSSLTDSDFILNGATNLGGAICALKIDNVNFISSFKNNYALLGGAINAPIIRNSKIDSKFANNTALIGGAIATGIVNNTEIGYEFIGNTANITLGSDEKVRERVYAFIVDLINEYVGNVTLIEQIGQYIEEHQLCLGFGGAISVVGILENADISAVFEDNNGAVAGGAVSVLGLAIKDDILGNFTNNHAGIGGSLWLPIVEYSNISGEFNGNYAVQGGAIFTDIVKNDVINGSFMDNLAINNLDLIGADKLAWGGAICIDGILKDSIIDGYYMNNMATELGGAIGGINLVMNSNISGSFINNTAKIGGAIFTGYVNNTLIGANFTNNVAKRDGIENDMQLSHLNGFGGAICAIIAIQNSNITGNFEFNQAVAGGAIFICSEEIETRDYSFEILPSQNNAISSNFVANAANCGAAIYIAFTSSNNKFNSNFINNTAADDGIVYLTESVEDSIFNCLFMNNSAANSIVHIENALNTNITNNIFLNSTRTYDISHNGHSDSKLSVNDNWFGHNSTNYKDSPMINGTVECNTWLFLAGAADPASVSYLGSSDIVFDLFVYNNVTGASTDKFDYSLLEPITLAINSTNGKVNKDAVSFADVIKFSSDGKKGTVTAYIGNAYETVVINCLPRISSNDLEMDYLGADYKIQVFDENGNPVVGEVVKITVNSRTYNVTTDKNGYATLTIRLMPKTYTITSAYNGTTNKNTLKVKNTLKTKTSFAAKKTAGKLVLKATLKWSNGKAIAGKNVIFKIKGKKFSVNTDKNGIAEITLSIKIISKKTVKITFKKINADLIIGKSYKMHVAYKNETVVSKLTIK